MNHFLETDVLLDKKVVSIQNQTIKTSRGKVHKPTKPLLAFRIGFRRGFASFADIGQKHQKKTKALNIVHMSGGRVDLAWCKVGSLIEEASDAEVKLLGRK
ncbi:MAG: hypothetical protein V3V13_01485 [Paracoccaceae bacterium]